MARGRSAVAVGVGLAALAATLFGATTPLVARAGKAAGPFATAALLYLGSALAAAALAVTTPRSGRRLALRDGARLAAVATLGAAIAPTLLAWGLTRAGATTGSLLLNAEAVFTAGLAWAFHREPVGRRMLVALALLAGGGALLVPDAAQDGTGHLVGALAVVAATLAWALDNTLTRAFADHDVASVVGAKSALGAGLTAAATFVLGERAPGPLDTAILIACGVFGYGLSLRVYLLAQRRVGAARTGSVFALAPFVGAGLAWALGDRALGPMGVVSAVLIAAGVALHATERHAHAHAHDEVEHEHAHRHDDDHHDHVHEPAFVGEHTHLHRHGAVMHEHDHAPDLHHDHAH